MIRIDLGKDDLKGGTSGGLDSLSGKFKGGALGKLRFSGVSKLVGNMSGLGIVMIFGSASALPHLFFTQYRDTVIKLESQKVDTARARIAALTAEIEKLTPYQKELESFEAQKRLVQDRLDIIRGLLTARSTPVNVLDGIGQALPQKVWISTIEFDNRKDSSVATLAGSAITNEDVSDFVDKLSESIHLEEVSLDSVATTKAGNSSTEWRSFNITAVPKGSQVTTSRPVEAARAVAGAPPIAPAPAVPPPAKGPGAGIE